MVNHTKKKKKKKVAGVKKKPDEQRPVSGVVGGGSGGAGGASSTAAASGYVSGTDAYFDYSFSPKLYEDMPLLVPVGESLGNSWDCAEYWYMSPEDLQRKALVEKELGNEAFKAEQFDLALMRYSKAIRLDPTNSIFYSNRAFVYLKLERFYEAITDCTASIDRQPTVKAYARRAAARAALHHYELASADYKRALAFEPSNQVCLSELVKCLDHLQLQLKRVMLTQPMIDEATRRMTREIELDIVRYGKQLKEAEETASKRTRLNQLIAHQSAQIQRDKCNSMAYLKRAEAYIQLGEYDKAMMDYKSGLRFDPDNKDLQAALKTALKLKDPSA